LLRSTRGRRTRVLPRRHRIVLRRALAIAVVVAAASLAQRARAAADAEWFPLNAGAQWIFDVHRDLTLSPEKAALNRLFYNGRATWIAEPAPDRGAGAYLIRQTTVQNALAQQPQREATVEFSVYSFAGELRMLMSGAVGAGGTASENVYKPPLRILPTTTVGESWDAGTFRQGDQRALLRGKVIGIEDLDGEPAWKGCLKVQLQGEITGSTEITDVRAEIVTAHYDRTVWFARGVGIVRDTTTVTSELKLPDGRHAKSLQVSTERLVEHRPSK
jgi:hypothetical protein